MKKRNSMFTIPLYTAVITKQEVHTLYDLTYYYIITDSTWEAAPNKLILLAPPKMANLAILFTVVTAFCSFSSAATCQDPPYHTYLYW